MRTTIQKIAKYTGSGIVVSTISYIFVAILCAYLVDEYLLAVHPELKDNVLWGTFFSTLSVVYAVIVGFLLVTVLNRYNDLYELVTEEVNNIEDIRDLTLFIDDEGLRKDIIKKIRKYVKNICDVEWHHMEISSTSFDSDTSKPLYKLMGSINKLRGINSERETFNLILVKVLEITTYRTKRIERSRRALPPVLDFYIRFTSMVQIIAFMFIAVPNQFVHSFIMACIVTALHLLYHVLMDFDAPFVGYWAISKEPFVNLLRDMKAHQRLISQQADIFQNARDKAMLPRLTSVENSDESNI